MAMARNIAVSPSDLLFDIFRSFGRPAESVGICNKFAGPLLNDI
jgi:hypothetical protein